MSIIKICGIKRPECYNTVLQSGATHGGFLIGQTHTSRDFVTLAAAEKMISSTKLKHVLVTHWTDYNSIAAALRTGLFQTVQLHDHPTPDVVKRIHDQFPKIEVWKAFPVLKDTPNQWGQPYAPNIHAFLLDSANLATGQIGGTGHTHDWNHSTSIMQLYSNKAFILAGGLHPDNVRNAIQQVRPAGVDVNSGTKDANGWKDSAKTNAFVRNALIAFDALEVAI